MGALQVVSELDRVAVNWTRVDSVKLRDAFFSPDKFVNMKDVDSFLRGMMLQPIKVQLLLRGMCMSE